MSRLFLSIVCATAMAVGVAAQSGQQAASQGDNAKLTGCLAPLGQKDSPTGATGSTASTSEQSGSSEQFALFNPSMGPAASPSSGAVKPSADEQVLLKGQDFKKYEGHTVEVSGNWAGENGQATGTTGSTADTTGQRKLRTFLVTSVTNVGAACSITGR